MFSLPSTPSVEVDRGLLAVEFPDDRPIERINHITRSTAGLETLARDEAVLHAPALILVVYFERESAQIAVDRNRIRLSNRDGFFARNRGFLNWCVHRSIPV